MSKNGSISEDMGNYNEDAFKDIETCILKPICYTVHMDCIEPISRNSLEEMGDALTNQLTELLKEKGYKCTGGMSGRKEFYMYFQRDIYNLYEKPLSLKLELP